MVPIELHSMGRSGHRLPESGRALILFSRHGPTRLGDPYEGKGFAFDQLSTVACRPSGAFKGFN